MDRFTLTENIRRFRQLLAETSDPQRRRTLETLLAEEESKLAKDDGPLSWPRGESEH